MDVFSWSNGYENVMVYSTLILTHKNVIRKSAYWYKALAESKEIK